MVVVNPYAKKAKAPVAAAAAAAAAAPSGPVNPYTKPKPKLERQNQQPRSPPPVNASTTFSQAFGDVDPDAHFGEEERAQQVAFEESLASASAGNGSANATNSNNANGMSARDHHRMLDGNALHISTRQRGNPILAHIRNVPHQFSAMVPDYIFAPTRCALFLSLRYHNLHPNYIHRRIAELKSDFTYRMLLCYVDVDDNAASVLFLNDLCVKNNFTLILAWSEEESARYLETVKAFDGRDPTIIKGREYTEHIDQASHALGSVRSVNKTDASQLLTQFGTWKNLAGASIEELSVCPGVGPKKVRRLWEAFHRPFSAETAKRRKEEREKEKKTSPATGDEAKCNDIKGPPAL
ncbi:hypothetical protein ACHAXT_007050 [Thalassiosira profunda]